MWMLEAFNKKPAAILFNKAEPIHVQGAILLNIPTLYGFGVDICKIIKTGDNIFIRNNIVEVNSP